MRTLKAAVATPIAAATCSWAFSISGTTKTKYAISPTGIDGLENGMYRQASGKAYVRA